MLLSPSTAPAVGVLETPAWLGDDGTDLAIQFAVCRAAGLGFLGLPAAPPQPVILVHHARTAEQLLEDVAAVRRRLGVAPAAEIPLRVVGFSDGDRLSKTPFLLRLRRTADPILEDLPPGLIVALDARATVGIGFDWDGREAWGAAGREGWPTGALQWQRWFSAEARWQLINVLTPYNDDESLGHFRKNAHGVARLEVDPADENFYRITEGPCALRLPRDDDGYMIAVGGDARNASAATTQTRHL